MDERSDRVEMACRLFDVVKLSRPAAARFAGLSRAAQEGELRQRNIPIYRPTIEDLQQDLATLRHISSSA